MNKRSVVDKYRSFIVKYESSSEKRQRSSSCIITRATAEANWSINFQNSWCEAYSVSFAVDTVCVIPEQLCGTVQTLTLSGVLMVFDKRSNIREVNRWIPVRNQTSKHVSAEHRVFGHATHDTRGFREPTIQIQGNTKMCAAPRPHRF